MKAKIKAVFKSTNNDVSQWRKHHCKTTIIDSLKNWQKIDQITLNDFEPKSEKEFRRIYNSLFINRNYLFIMKQIIKAFSKAYSSELTKAIYKIASIEPKDVKINVETATFNKKTKSGKIILTFNDIAKIGKGDERKEVKITRKLYIEFSNDIETRYLYDMKNGKITAKKRLIAVIKGQKAIDNNQTKHATKSNVEGLKKTIATNLGLSLSYLDDVDFTTLPQAKTAEELTACFMLSVAQSRHFVDIATKINELAKQAETETRQTNKVDNSYKTICADNGILQADYETALAITDNKNEAIQACLLSQKTGKTIAQCIEAYRTLFA